LKVSATIITLNEEANIRAACESVAWADEVIVVDSGSTDATCSIAAECGAHVIHHAWEGFARQKQFAADQASHDWIFSLDADERVSEALQDEIERLLSIQDQSHLADGYRIPRRSFYMGRWIKGGGWYPDYQLRLYRKEAGAWQGDFVHESVRMRPGSHVEFTKGQILHFSVVDAGHHHRMIGERYAPLAAQKMFAAGKRTSPIRIATAAPSAFIRSYILKGGFRDGVAGLSIAGFAAHHAFLKHLLLYEIQTSKAEPPRRLEQ
jgi:glycosyltransferase involved in cell wall biosynthesis